MTRYGGDLGVGVRAKNQAAVPVARYALGVIIIAAARPRCRWRGLMAYASACRRRPATHAFRRQKQHCDGAGCACMSSARSNAGTRRGNRETAALGW